MDRNRQYGRQRADTVFVGGQVFTGTHGTPVDAAVAVGAGRILAVADESAVRSLADAGTEVVDLAGGLLVPGFQDAHVHPVVAGVQMLGCDLSGEHSVDGYLAVVAAYAAAHPEAPWIRGGGWSMDVFPGGTPTRAMLDAVVPDRPVLLGNRDGHGAWVNTPALRLAGVDAGTPDPVDGRIEREPDGFPAGTLQEGAVDLVARHVPIATADEAHAGLLAAQEHLFSLGVTSWQDAMIGAFPGNPDNYDVYLRAAREGSLRARVVGALWWDRERGLEQIPEIEERRRTGRVGRFNATSVKIMQDGIAENFTAGMLEPYLDGCGCATGNSGLSFIDPELLTEAVRLLDRSGFQLHFHALGDRAVREVLDALEAARAANGANDNRHHLAHLQVVHPDDIARFARVGAAANIQALWAAHEPQMDELTIPFLGPERAALQYPFADLRRAGARLVAGSDWSVSSPNPLWGIHVAVNRTVPDEAAGTPDAAHGPDGPREPVAPFFPEQALTLSQALTAYTAGSAWANHLDGVTGTVEEGKYADLVVLDRNPFELPPGEIAGTRVRRTYLDGEQVFAAKD
ncbi:N-substituted formamide deformylase precursor [Streptomyces lavendulae subsp. lavendulae]|uniref:N-substituted formamide deformylase n=1 Tax=Streptomyces lavendulae subsp. lavendulae TaxID=58340 RepID=A0A2K8PAA7_STRLA|nr:amidohydrolase [Streptomyces lavendulae]ATZ22673.1 N-substituted formamide deformylase precursor [Streptomyces lavendulae subsp. lavendulae]QUQ52515.1 N-substituted formamide deformylase [Streptomyces lavendulae subsp. lavendulae]